MYDGSHEFYVWYVPYVSIVATTTSRVHVLPLGSIFFLLCIFLFISFLLFIHSSSSRDKQNVLHALDSPPSYLVVGDAAVSMSCPYLQHFFNLHQEWI